jgi:hypothetical protein
MISMQDFSFRGRLEPPRLRLREEKRRCFAQEAGGIRRIGHEGVLFLLGRVAYDMCLQAPQESASCTPINRWKYLIFINTLNNAKPEPICFLKGKLVRVLLKLYIAKSLPEYTLNEFRANCGYAHCSLNCKSADKKIPEEQVEYTIAVRQQKQNEAADYEPFDPSVHLDPSWE